MINIFERVEILNAENKIISLSFQEAQLKIEKIIISIQQLRDISVYNMVTIIILYYLTFINTNKIHKKM